MEGIKTKSGTDQYLVGMILLQVLIAGIFGAIIWFITGWWPSICLLLGLAIWSIMLLSTDLVNAFFVEIAEFSGAVFINQFRNDVLPESAQAAIDALHQPTESVREVSAGWHGKWPWERVSAVDLRRHTVIGSTIKAYTKDNIEVSVEWVDTLTPLQGFLVNHQRWSDDARKAFFEAAFQAHILATIKTLNENELFGQIDDEGGQVVGINFVKNKFANIFGGPNKASEEEKRYATFTNSPTIKRIERNEKYRNAAESVMIARQTNAAIQEFDRDIDRRLTMAAVLGSQGIDTVKTLQFVGKIEGLENAHTIVLGSASNLLGDNNKEKGK